MFNFSPKLRYNKRRQAYIVGAAICFEEVNVMSERLQRALRNAFRLVALLVLLLIADQTYTALTSEISGWNLIWYVLCDTLENILYIILIGILAGFVFYSMRNHFS